LREGFVRRGFREVAFSDRADTYVLNTCTVTNKADADARYFIRSCRRINPRAKVVVTGCYAQADAQSIRNIPGVSLVMGNADKNQIVFEVTGKGPREQIPGMGCSIKWRT